MRLYAENNSNYIQSLDTGSLVKLQVIDFNNSPVDLTKFNRVLVKIGRYSENPNLTGTLLTISPSNLSVDGFIEFTVPYDSLTSGTYYIEVHMTDTNGLLKISPSGYKFKFNIKRSLDELGKNVVTMSVQQLLDQISSVNSLAEQTNADSANAVVTANTANATSNDAKALVDAVYADVAKLKNDKIREYKYTIPATSNGQTDFIIPLVDFSLDTDLISVFLNTTALEEGMYTVLKVDTNYVVRLNEAITDYVNTSVTVHIIKGSVIVSHNVVDTLNATNVVTDDNHKFISTSKLAQIDTNTTQLADALYNVTLQNAKIEENIKAVNSVINSGTKINIFPKDFGAWSLGIFDFAVGQPSNSSGYVLSSINYRHDTVDLIKVNPGAVLTFTVSGDYKVAVHQFDVNKKGVVDSGYQTTTLTLSASTHYVRLLCSRNDSAYHSLDDMIANANIVVSVNLNDLPELPETKPVVQNLIPTSINTWENGGIDVNGNYSNVTNRIRPVQGLWISPINRMRKFFYSVASGYCLTIIGYDNSNISRFDTGWSTGNGSFFVPENVTKLIPILSHPDDSVISISEVINAQPLLAIENIMFEYSKLDLVKTVESMNNKRNEDSIMGLSDKFRYVGHRGLMQYAPENTLEAFRLSAFLGMWGAETDLGLTSDKQLVLMHDYSVDRTTNGTGNVSDLTLAQIKELNIDTGLVGFANVKVPTFEEYLSVCKDTGLYPVIEIKEDGNATGMTDLVLSILEKYNFTKTCIIESFSSDVLKRIRTKNSYIKLAYLLRGKAVITNGDIATAKSIGNCLLYADATSNLTETMVQSAHKEGIPVWVWAGVIDETLANTLISIGVDSITSDNLIPKNRDKKIFSATVSTSDRGVTWKSGTSKLREKVTAIALDNTTLKVAFDDSFIQTYIIKFDPIISARDLISWDIPYTITCTYDTSQGFLKLQFYNNGVKLNVNSLPRSYMNLHIEVML